MTMLMQAVMKKGETTTNIITIALVGEIRKKLLVVMMRGKGKQETGIKPMVFFAYSRKKRMKRRLHRH